MDGTQVVDRTSTEFSLEQFQANARSYAAHKGVIDAIAKQIARPKGGYDNFDDAIAQVSAVWRALRDQAVDGAGFTPPVELGFGSNNAAQVAGALTGDKVSVAEIRKSFAALGK